uniref:NADH-ubiquinone oxidoreductase chain 2 n=1 Tax=Asotana magnifica TaxID=2528170 RepID=A0A4P8DN48_9CRUS|nr:NADH dehydrogenase subunit 2 [Asotana magnifica]
MYVKSVVSLLGVMSGVTLAISSENPFGIWFGLELNVISFIVFLSSTTKNSTTCETMMKYFLAQTIASFIFLLTMLLSHNKLPTSFITLSMVMKMGGAPFHFWLLQMIESLPWKQLYLLMTIQKIAPLTILTYVSNMSQFLLILLSMLSAIVSSVGNMNEMSFRKLLTFSSISHIAWMLFSMLLSYTLWIMYFTIYFLTLMILVMILSSYQTYHFSQLILPKFKSHHKLTILVSMLSLMGMPPMLGFLPKMLIILYAMKMHLFIWIFILIMASVITMYYYLRMSITMILLKQPSMPTLTVKHTKLALLVITNMMGLISMPLLLPLQLH